MTQTQELDRLADMINLGLKNNIPARDMCYAVMEVLLEHNITGQQMLEMALERADMPCGVCTESAREVVAKLSLN